MFIDGCFWHGCPVHGSQPRTNSDYWGPKIAGNVERDRRQESALRAAGWTVIRAWEHESAFTVADRIEALILETQGAKHSGPIDADGE